MENYAATLPDATGKIPIKCVRRVSALSEGRVPHFLRPHSPVSSPQGEDIPKYDFRRTEDHPANSVAKHFKHAAYVSPSPGGEGRGEDGRQKYSCFRNAYGAGFHPLQSPVLR